MIISDYELEKLRAIRAKEREHGFNAAADVIGNDALVELKKLVDIYDEKMYIWLSELWKPRIGGFYYSPSARNNEGFLPDLESTGQALQFIHDSGLCPDYKDIPEKIKMKMISFARELQSAEDGFFYHPQWGKDIPTSRRGRDLVWANGIIQKLGGTMKHPSPLDSQAKAAPKRAEHLSDIRAFKKYLSEFEEPNSKYYVKKHSYPLGNLLASQGAQIKAAGSEFILCVKDFLDRHQYSHNGLWEEETDYDPVNGLMKISTLYSMLGLELPNAEQALKSALNVALKPDGANRIVFIYNPLCAMKEAINSITLSRGAEYADNIRKIILNSAPEVISAARNKVLRFKKNDGSFSYCPDRSADKSQGVPVAIPNTNEGDVNSTKISLCAVLGETCGALGINRPSVFSLDDGNAFFRLVENI
ncbi:MAG: hypothetical protein J6B48_07855 [Clostridia bacterium]|nr:hypothetical protein [Clostridia bacterium]